MKQLKNFFSKQHRKIFNSRSKIAPIKNWMKFCANCSRLNPKGQYLSSQLTWVIALLFVKCFSPVHPVDESPPMFLAPPTHPTPPPPPYVWANGPSVVFVAMVSMVLVLWELVFLYEMGVEFKSKIMLNYSMGRKWQQDVTTGIGFSYIMS